MAKKDEGLKLFKKGDVIYQAGDTADRLFLIQQGLVSLFVAGRESEVEIYKAIQPHVFGTEVLENLKTYSTSAKAMGPLTLQEIPAARAKEFLKKAPQLVQSLAQAMITKNQKINSELSVMKLEHDSVACPLNKLTKLFSVIYHVVSYKGEKKNEKLVVAWPAFRKYCQRVFLESPVRLEQAMYALSNLGIAELQMVKDEIDPDLPEDLGYVHFQNIEQVGAFAEYFRKNFKPEDPTSLQTMMTSNNSVSRILKEIQDWNRTGRPHGMPEPPDPNAKFPPPGQKKKAG